MLAIIAIAYSFIYWLTAKSDPPIVQEKPVLIKSYDIVGDDDKIHDLKIYRVKTNRGWELISTEK